MPTVFVVLYFISLVDFIELCFKKRLMCLASGAKGQFYTNQPRQGVSLPRLLV